MEKPSLTAIEAALQKGGSLAVNYAFSITGAIILLIVGFFIAGLFSRWTRRGMASFDAIEETLAQFFANVVYYAVLILVLVTVLAQFGVQTTSIIAALGAAGLAIGLALQGTLQNIAAGIMLLVLRPLRVGEYVEAGDVSGTVVEVGLFMTELRRPDGLFVMAPNSRIWNQSITNYSRHPTRRFEIVVGVAYEDDMEKAKNELLGIAASEERVLDDPAPEVFVNSLDESSVGIGLRAWIRTADFWKTSRALTQAAKQRFDEKGISIPFPQREIRQK